MLAGINYVLGPTKGHLSASYYVRVKMNSEKGPKRIYAKERKLYYYYYNSGGHWEIMNWKKNPEKFSLNNNASVRAG